MDLSRVPISTMAAAIVARLRLAFPAKEFSLERIPSVLSHDEFRRVTRHAPFIGLAWLGLMPDSVSGRILHGWMRWRLALIVKASSSLDARFAGDTRDIGLDAMIDVATALLHGAVFDGIGNVEVTGGEAAYAEGFADEAIVVAQLDFRIQFSWSPAPLKLVTPADFKALGVTWFVNASADPENGPELPQEIVPPQPAPAEEEEEEETSG